VKQTQQCRAFGGGQTLDQLDITLESAGGADPSEPGLLRGLAARRLAGVSQLVLEGGLVCGDRRQLDARLDPGLHLVVERPVLDGRDGLELFPELFVQRISTGRGVARFVGP
jgi:hypothetical protein